jgi:hypothetical protein
VGLLSRSHAFVQDEELVGDATPLAEARLQVAQRSGTLEPTRDALIEDRLEQLGQGVEEADAAVVRWIAGVVAVAVAALKDGEDVPHPPLLGPVSRLPHSVECDGERLGEVHTSITEEGGKEAVRTRSSRAADAGERMLHFQRAERNIKL